MKHKYQNHKKYSANFSSILQPALAWILIIGLFLFTNVGIFLGLGKLMNLAFPLGAFIIGIFLYIRYPILYLGFTWWLWFTTPLIRRLADYYSSFTDPSPILLAPLMVTMITFYTFWCNFPRQYRSEGLPFILAFIGIIYGFFTGILQNSAISVILSLLDWLSPVLFGFHIFVNWRQYPAYRSNIQRVFFWGILIMGVYGVFQFLLAPPWENYWLIKTELSSFGYPKPLKIRVWSTMNSPQVFAATLMPGLILLFINKGSQQFLAYGGSYLAFLLSRARAPWLGFLTALLIFIPSLKSHLQIKIIASILIASLLIVPLTSLDQFSTTIGSRLGSLSSTEQDNSLKERTIGYEKLLGQAISQVIGKGLGYQIEDSNIGGNDGAILPALFSLGWIGILPYLTGFILIIFQLFQHEVSSLDSFAIASRSIVIGTIIQIPFNFITVAPIAITLWSFIGIRVAASKYYKYYKID